MGGSLFTLSFDSRRIKSLIRVDELMRFMFSSIDLVSVIAINPDTILSIGNPKSLNRCLWTTYATTMVVEYIKIFPIVRDNPELVMGNFSFFDAQRPLTKSTKIRKYTERIMFFIGAKKERAIITRLFNKDSRFDILMNENNSLT